MMSIKSLITGVTGQDGSYLAELLLSKGHTVYGMVRRTSNGNQTRIKHLLENPKFILKWGDMADETSLNSLIKDIMPDLVFNLAAQSHVGLSFKLPVATVDVTGLGTLRLLEALRTNNCNARFYQASSSELFGDVIQSPQDESTLFNIRSPYAAAKLFSYWVVVNYRQAYGMHASNGILFNHESPRRGDDFVTKKIVKQMVEIWRRQRDTIKLGNLDAKRDWGYAKDYVEAMLKIVEHDTPDDYVIATGESHSIREFVEVTAEKLGMEIKWEGEGLEEKGYDIKSNRVVIEIDREQIRPTDVNLLRGDFGKAKEVLGWKPTTSFKELVDLMVEGELNGTI